MFEFQADLPTEWPDGRPNPWADLSKSSQTIMGHPVSRYFGWPVVCDHLYGSIWRLGDDRFCIRLKGRNGYIQFRTLELAIKALEEFHA